MENVLDIRVNNEKIQEHINKLFTEILKEQKKYMGVKKPDEEKSHLTEDLLKKYESMRGKGFSVELVQTYLVIHTHFTLRHSLNLQLATPLCVVTFNHIQKPTS